jgi:hypothetical protein
MKRPLVIGLIGVVVLVCLCCLVFGVLSLLRGGQKGLSSVEPTPGANSSNMGEIVTRLDAAPWRGLRFLPEQSEWCFYAVAGERSSIEIVAPFDVLKVYYLEPNGALSTTWVSLGVAIPGGGYYSTASAAIQPGDLVEVAIGGPYVSQDGVDWDLCDTAYCRLAQTVDTSLVLDDQGTGLTNAFIRTGHEPPLHPMYGFLCWQVRPIADAPALLSSR